MPRAPSSCPCCPAQVGLNKCPDRGLREIGLLRCVACQEAVRMFTVSSRYELFCLLRADDSGAETALLLDDQTFEVTDRFQLDCTEARPCCKS